jgi:putative tryptophan/tyrosine transport system substrate-binding protein
MERWCHSGATLQETRYRDPVRGPRPDCRVCIGSPAAEFGSTLNDSRWSRYDAVFLHHGAAMKRREFVAGLGIAATLPLPARAQKLTLPVIGMLGAPSAATYVQNVAAVHQGLNEAGYIDGTNVTIEYRWADGQYDRLPMLASELVEKGVAIIITIGGAPSTIAARNATSTIPIVFTMTADPVRLGLVASLNRPGGNITGVAILGVALEAKRLEILHELVPAAKLIAVLINPKNPQAEIQTIELAAASRTVGQEIILLEASNNQEIDTAFEVLADRGAGAVIIGQDTFFTSQPAQFAALAKRYAKPTISPWREHVSAGMLISYGASIADGYRQAGVYAGRVLKGDKPANLPIVQPTKFEMVINLRTAKALGVTVPPSLLAQSDEVFE